MKTYAPKIRIVIGGSTFFSRSTPHLFQFFPEIDYLVVGEGELPLKNLVAGFLEKGSVESLKIPALFKKSFQQEKDPIEPDQLPDLRLLPAPDYDDYFERLKQMAPDKRFFPVLPIEMSRGCPWQGISSGKNSGGCAFCNLNLQWKGYRIKDPDQVAADIRHLVSTHQVLSVAFTDNLIPKKCSKSLFKALSQMKIDFHLFCEVRADIPFEALCAMKAAGLVEVQAGIESLSRSLLKRIRKGTTAIQNLEFMKNCEALGILNRSNLILQFPQSSDSEVEETLRTMDYAYPYRPLRGVEFWLGAESPIWLHPQSFGINLVFNHPNYQKLFPKEIARDLPMMIQAYRGDVSNQRRKWASVRRKLKEWEKAYATLHKGFPKIPILSFRDGAAFILIQERRLNAPSITHRLTGISRLIYLFCQHRRSIHEILHRFKGMPAEKIGPFLKMMVDKKLMYQENEVYLSLAIPVTGEKGLPVRDG
ncbi:MAG: RiPP maturation radical SAM C-methyltransferase [Thermodesulfobacteriota bacterium]